MLPVSAARQRRRFFGRCLLAGLTRQREVRDVGIRWRQRRQGEIRRGLLRRVRLGRHRRFLRGPQHGRFLDRRIGRHQLDGRGRCVNTSDMSSPAAAPVGDNNLRPVPEPSRLVAERISKRPRGVLVSDGDDRGPVLLGAILPDAVGRPRGESRRGRRRLRLGGSSSAEPCLTKRIRPTAGCSRHWRAN